MVFFGIHEHPHHERPEARLFAVLETTLRTWLLQVAFFAAAYAAAASPSQWQEAARLERLCATVGGIGEPRCDPGPSVQ